MVKNVDFNIFYEMLVLDTNIYWTSWYLQLLPCMLPLYICLNLWLAVAVAALTNLPVTSVHISQLGGPSIWFLHTYLLLSRYTQWRHMCHSATNSAVIAKWSLATKSCWKCINRKNLHSEIPSGGQNSNQNSSLQGLVLRLDICSEAFLHYQLMSDYFASVLERIVNFGTNQIPNTYSIVRTKRTKYQVITRSQKTIWVVFEYLKLFE